MRALKTIFCVAVAIIIILFGVYGILIKDLAPLPLTSTGDVTVHFIDVGQGDCTLIQTENGNILIDAGPFSSRNNVINYVDNLGIKEFEYAIFTHPHEDHIGAAKTVLEEYDFKNVIMSDALHTTATFNFMIDAIENEGCNVIEAIAGDSYMFGTLKIDILAPDADYDRDDLNNMSVVCKITYGDVSFMFTGDAEEYSEESILRNGYDIDADILKVGHHGSSTSSSAQFIYDMMPSVAVISAGEDNEYGHPHKETINLLSGLNVETYVTFESGSVVIVTDGTQYSIKTEK